MQIPPYIPILEVVYSRMHNREEWCLDDFLRAYDAQHTLKTLLVLLRSSANAFSLQPPEHWKPTWDTCSLSAQVMH